MADGVDDVVVTLQRRLVCGGIAPRTAMEGSAGAGVHHAGGLECRSNGDVGDRSGFILSGTEVGRDKIVRGSLQQLNQTRR